MCSMHPRKTYITLFWLYISWLVYFCGDVSGAAALGRRESRQNWRTLVLGQQQQGDRRPSPSICGITLSPPAITSSQPTIDNCSSWMSIPKPNNHQWLPVTSEWSFGLVSRRIPFSLVWYVCEHLNCVWFPPLTVTTWRKHCCWAGTV